MQLSTNSQSFYIAVAGSTAFSTQVTQTLINHPDRKFKITNILTPAPKPVGRHKTIIPNPLHQLAFDQEIPQLLVNRSLKHYQQQILEQMQPSIDVLLVVDFGYLIPQWLLDLPKLATINIHPSKLPEWRGSSPGQCVLLSGSRSSAVTIMQLDNQLDHGPILDQIEFAIDDNWTASDYYQHAFDLACHRLSEVIIDLSNKTLSPTPQPDISPTPLARLLTKNDGFIHFSLIKNLMEGVHVELSSLARHAAPKKSGSASSAESLGTNPTADTTIILDVIQDPPTPSSPHPQADSQAPTLLAQLYPIFCHNRQINPNLPSSLTTYLSQTTKALAPWPGLWTKIPTKKETKIMKIMSCNWNNQSNRLELEKVQIAGQQPALWSQVKNVVEDDIKKPTSP